MFPEGKIRIHMRQALSHPIALDLKLTFQSPPSEKTKEMRLQISVWAEDLPQGKDPFAVLTNLSMNGTTTLLGQTEVLCNTTCPDWTKMFYLENITLGESTHIVVTLFTAKQSLGAAVFDIGAVLGSKGSTLAKQLKNKGTVFMHVEQAKASGMLQFQLRAVDLINMEGLGFLNKSDPFFEFQRMRESTRQQCVWDTVFRSTPLKNNLDPVWVPSFLEVDALCSDCWDQEFRIVVYDYNNDGKHVEMGIAFITLKQLSTVKDIELTLSGKPAGKIIVMEAKVIGSITTQSHTSHAVPTVGASVDEKADVPVAVEHDIAVAVDEEEIVLDNERREPTFANYISGGCQLRMIVAIDVTASNGDPRQDTSLHHFQDNGRNAYESAIQSLGSIVSKFDSDQKFPVWGFGAKVKGEVSHCFSLAPGAEVDGIDGIIDAYRTTLRSGLSMSSPRDFSEVIQRAAVDSKTRLNEEQAYSILLLLTNGGPTNIGKTLSALQATKSSPLSIVIVGVGNGTFEGIEKLVAQHNLECRENVCYVHCKSLETALDGIPAQLEAYFTKNDIYPRPEALVDDIVVQPYNTAEEIEVPIAIHDDGKASVTGNVSKDNFSKFMKQVQDGSRLLMKNQRLCTQHKRTFGRMKQQFNRMFK